MKARLAIACLGSTETHNRDCVQHRCCGCSLLAFSGTGLLLRVQLLFSTDRCGTGVDFVQQGKGQSCRPLPFRRSSGIQAYC